MNIGRLGYAAEIQLLTKNGLRKNIEKEMKMQTIQSRAAVGVLRIWRKKLIYKYIAH